MKRIEIDEEVYQALLKLMKPFEDTPNILRRLLGLDEVHKERQEKETVIKAEKDYEHPIEEMITSLGLEKKSVLKSRECVALLHKKNIEYQIRGSF